MCKHLFPAFIPVLFFSVSSFSQIKAVSKANAVVNNTNATVNQANATIGQTANTVNSAVNGVKSIKAAMGSLFPKKNKGAGEVVIAIAGIGYDDDNLSALKESIRKVKGVKDLKSDYKAGTVFLNVNFKGDGSELWDKLSKDDKQLFKLSELTDGNLIIEYKKPKAEVSSSDKEVTKAGN